MRRPQCAISSPMENSKSDSFHLFLNPFFFVLLNTWSLLALYNQNHVFWIPWLSRFQSNKKQNEIRNIETPTKQKTNVWAGKLETSNRIKTKSDAPLMWVSLESVLGRSADGLRSSISFRLSALTIGTIAIRRVRQRSDRANWFLRLSPRGLLMTMRPGYDTGRWSRLSVSQSNNNENCQSIFVLPSAKLEWSACSSRYNLPMLDSTPFGGNLYRKKQKLPSKT